MGIGDFAIEFEQLCKKHKAVYEVSVNNDYEEVTTVFTAKRYNHKSELVNDVSCEGILENMSFEPVKIKRGRGRPRKES